MINTLFNHIKQHKLVYGIGAFALIAVLVMFALQGNNLKYSSNLSGNINWAGARITEEQFGQEIEKTIQKEIEKIGYEKWEMEFSDEERGRVIDEAFQKTMKKYNLSEKEERRERVPPEDGDEEENGYKIVEIDPNPLEDAKTIKGRLPKVVDPKNVQFNPPACDKAATLTTTVAAVPASAETIQIGSCVVSFGEYGDDTDEINCSDSLATISRKTATGGAGTARSASQIDNVIDSLTNVTDPKHGVLQIGSGSANTTTFTANKKANGNIIFKDGTGGDVTANNTAGQACTPPPPKGTLSASQSYVSTNAPMPNSGGTLYDLKLTANGGDASFTELVFDVKTKDLASGGNEDIYDWKMYGQSSKLYDCSVISGEGKQVANNATVSLYSSPYGSGLKNANTTKPGVDDGLYKVVVKCNNPVTVSNGNTINYQLRASIGGATTNDKLDVMFSQTENKGISNLNILKPFTFME